MPKIKVLVEFSFWLSFWLTKTAFLLSLHMAFLVHVHGEKEKKPFVRMLILSDQGLIFVTPFNLNYFHKRP